MSAEFSLPRALPRVFDPSRAQRIFEALGDATAGAPQNARRLFESAFGNSAYLGRLALRERALLREFWEQGPQPIVERALTQAAAAGEAHEMASAMAMLRNAKRSIALAVALADIAALWDLETVTGALTRFADASVSGALRFLLARAAGEAAARDRAALEAESGLIVLAMGKAGAHELNYSSDLDLVIFYDAEKFPYRKKDDPRGAAVDLVKGLVKLLGETTADGYVFRTDLRLRPDAGATQIAISADAAERYYEEMGQNWERAAMIKARACAGDRRAAESFLKRLEPFVWRRSLDYQAIEDIHSIKRQIHAHGGHRAIAAAGHNLKLGRGGIREIEFFVQTQQLILGGRDHALRGRPTLDALAALRARSLISGRAHAELGESYRYLRTLEHRLQMIDDEQTHAIPQSQEGLAQIACFAGYSGSESFSQTLVAHLRRVQEHYDGLFQKSAALGGAAGSLVFTGVEDDPDTLGTLRGFGFRDPHHVAAAVRGWHHGRIRATRSARARELLTRLVPTLLESLGETADADAAFAQLDRFLSRLPGGVQLFSLLLANPHMLKLLAAIMGSAPRLAAYLAGHPSVLDSVLDPGFLAAFPQRGALDEGLAAQMQRAPDRESALDTVRRFAQEQLFRAGVQLIEASISPLRAAGCYSDIAESVIASLLDRTEAELHSVAGAIEGGAFCVVAMGKLGGREMTATSDLDLIFVYEAPPGTDRSNGPRGLPVMVYYARLAQRLIAALTVFTSAGGLYDVDMRLRPSGNKGPAAVSLEAFRRYHGEDAWTWERLALVRARVIAGPGPLRAKVEAVIRAALTRRSDPVLLARETRAMRAKMASQFPPRCSWDLKFAAGGLVDIEFVTQFLLLCHAHERPQILAPGTLAALDGIAQARLLEDRDAAALIDAACLQLALLQLLRLCLAGRTDAAPADAGTRSLLTRAGGETDFAALESRLAAVQKEARGVFDRLLRGPGLQNP